MGALGTLTVGGQPGRGFDATPIAGTGLDAGQQVALEQRLDAGATILQAIHDAMARARARGADEFRAADANTLQLPVWLGTAQRDGIFSEVLGRPWSGAAQTLAQWAAAASQLEHWLARNRSSLPPGIGGGPQNVNGQWYVNGEAFSLADLFTATRVNLYNALDESLQTSLNTIAANNRLVHRLTAMLKDGRSYTTGNALALAAVNGYYQEGHVWDDAYPRPDRVHWLTVRDLALALIGSKSKLVQSINNDANLNAEDWKTAMDELSTIIDSKTADNQVTQQRTESVISLRTNLLDGLTNLLKGQQNMNSNRSRNFG